MKYDVVYLGSGHSVWHDAITLAAAGKRIAIVDGDLPGGTCTNYGCDAKIILDGPFEFAEGLERYQGLCVEGNGKIDWCKLMEYKRQVLAPFPPDAAGHVPGCKHRLRARVRHHTRRPYREGGRADPRGRMHRHRHGPA